MTILRSFAERHTYIAHGEAFAILFGMSWEQQSLRNCSVIWYTDNLGVLSALCSGYGSVSDFGGVIHAIHLSSARCSSVHGGSMWTQRRVWPMEA